jgi:ABC-type uncharacterized transport system permease subunit
VNLAVLFSAIGYPYLILLAYVLLAVWVVWRGDAPKPLLEQSLLGVILLGHAPMVALPLMAMPPYFGARESVSMLVWVSATIYWLAAFRLRLTGLLPVLLPIAAAMMLLSALLPVGHNTPWLAAPAMQLHFAIAMLAYGFLAETTGLALLMRLADRELHRPQSSLLRRLPPVLLLERLLFSSMALGFALLSATLLSGIIFSEQLFGHALRFNHKTVLSIAAWLVFGGLLLGRHFRGWRGRLAVNWTLAGFGFLVLAYIGSRFVVEVILHRTS